MFLLIICVNIGGIDNPKQLLIDILYNILQHMILYLRKLRETTGTFSSWRRPEFLFCLLGWLGLF